MRVPPPEPALRCQYPLWGDERPTHLHCGAPAAPGSSYCARHHARCWMPAPRLLPALPVAPPDPESWLSVLSGGSA